MKNWELYEKGFGYNLVAVFGSQSTGKSAFVPSYRDIVDIDGEVTGTLLNRLFGTKFDVMKENERRQTTKGTALLSFSVVGRCCDGGGGEDVGSWNQWRETEGETAAMRKLTLRIQQESGCRKERTSTCS